MYVCPFCSRESEKYRILYEDDMFFCVSAYGALVPGHSLFITKKHYNSFAHFLCQEHFDFWESLRLFTEMLREKFWPIVLFEHGSYSEIQDGCACITHAHLHLLPCDFDVEVNSLSSSVKKISDFKDIGSNYQNKLEYLFYQNQNWDKYIFDVPEDSESQFFRRVFAEKFWFQDGWNWRDDPLNLNMYETIKRMQGK